MNEKKIYQDYITAKKAGAILKVMSISDKVDIRAKQYHWRKMKSFHNDLLLFSRLVASNSLRPHGL